MAIITPVVLLIVGFITFVGRVTLLNQNTQTAAADAARAASLHTSVHGAETAAVEAAEATLSDAGVSCEHLDVAVDAVDLAPGGSVEATIRCQVSLKALNLLPFPGDRTVEARAVQVLDRYAVRRP